MDQRFGPYHLSAKGSAPSPIRLAVLSPASGNRYAGLPASGTARRAAPGRKGREDKPVEGKCQGRAKNPGAKHREVTEEGWIS